MAEKTAEKNVYWVAGFCFSDSRDYKSAKHEAESVEYIKANTDLTEIDKVLKLYNRLVEQKTFKTVVGYSFLKELQNMIIEQGIVIQENLLGIYIEPKLNYHKNSDEIEVATDRSREELYLKKAENIKIKHRNSRIINVFLALIIMIMIAINLFHNNSILSSNEKKLIDKYAAWEDQLTQKEQELNQRESKNNLQE